MVVFIIIVILSWGAWNGKCNKCGTVEFGDKHLWLFVLGWFVCYWLLGEPPLGSGERM